MPGKIRMKTNAEATVAVQFNQGTTKGMGCFIPFVVPWVTFFSSKQRSIHRNQ
jgi:hypothetical protein